MDSFFASVEVRANPELKGKPVLVGGSARRGVVASCSYEARRFGIHSAMPMATALRLCPSAVVLPGDLSTYAQVSRQIHRIFRDVTPLVEPLALDEAFLDVTGAVGLLGTPFEMAVRIRSTINDELSLDCAVGVGPSKLVAKLASKHAKPSIVDGKVTPGPGVVVIMPDEVRSFLDEMGVRALFGVGPATATTLERLGIERVAALASFDPELLVRHLGRTQAYGLVALARGEDDRPVVPDQVSKSVGHEETFAEDVADKRILEQRLRRQAVAVSGALHDAGRRGRTVSVKAKDTAFKIRTRSQTLRLAIDDHVAIFEVARALLDEHDVSEGIRLLGLSVSNLEDAAEPIQLLLDVGDDELPEAKAEQLQQERAALEEAIDEIRARFGRHVLGAASSLETEGVRVPSQRDVPFGPSADDQA
jgi:DNA polymerase-4